MYALIIVFRINPEIQDFQTPEALSKQKSKIQDFLDFKNFQLYPLYLPYRHILLSAHMDFTDSMWHIVIDSLENALDVTTYCLRQLMLLFKTNSENFYGDIGQVKVATRKDCSMMEFVRMWHLAQQVGSQIEVKDYIGFTLVILSILTHYKISFQSISCSSH